MVGVQGFYKELIGLEVGSQTVAGVAGLVDGLGAHHLALPIR